MRVVNFSTLNLIAQYVGVHGYSPNFIFPKIYSTGIRVTELPIALIFIFPVHLIT